jgi:hypothetical protein
MVIAHSEDFSFSRFEKVADEVDVVLFHLDNTVEFVKWETPLGGPPVYFDLSQ